MKENLLAVKNEKLTSNPKETMSSIAKKWHLLGSESKSSYKHRASVAKEEYLHKIKEFEAGPLKDFLVNRKSLHSTEKIDESNSSSGSESSDESSSEEEVDSEAEEILQWKKKNR